MIFQSYTGGFLLLHHQLFGIAVEYAIRGRILEPITEIVFVNIYPKLPFINGEQKQSNNATLSRSFLKRLIPSFSNNKKKVGITYD